MAKGCLRNVTRLGLYQMFRTCHHIAINHRLFGLSIIVQVKSIHNTLKINVYHIHGVEEKWIEGNLNDRKQCVTFHQVH